MHIFWDRRAYYKKKSNEDLEKEKLAAEVELKQAKAEQEKIYLSELQGEMHRSEDVADCISQLVYAIRTDLMALPGRIAVDIVGAANAEEASVMLRDEVNAILNGLADFEYDPDFFATKVRERKGWQTSDQSEEEEESQSSN